MSSEWTQRRHRKVIEDIRNGFACTCPKCRRGAIYAEKWALDVRDTCPVCGFDLSKNDSADGPAVFLIFLLGALIVPMALIFEYAVHPPLWVHGIVWGLVTLGMTLGLLRPLKAYVITLQYRYRASDWEGDT